MKHYNHEDKIQQQQQQLPVGSRFRGMKIRYWVINIKKATNN